MSYIPPIVVTPGHSPQSSRSSSPAPSESSLGSQSIVPVEERVRLYTSLYGIGNRAQMTGKQEDKATRCFGVIKAAFEEAEESTDFVINFTLRMVSWTNAQGEKEEWGFEEVEENPEFKQALLEMERLIEQEIFKDFGIQISNRQFLPGYQGLYQPGRFTDLPQNVFKQEQPHAVRGIFSDKVYTDLWNKITGERPEPFSVVQKRSIIMKRMIQLEVVLSLWISENQRIGRELQREIERLNGERQALQARNPQPDSNEANEIIRLSKKIIEKEKQSQVLGAVYEKLSHVDLFAIRSVLVHYPQENIVVKEQVIDAAKKLVIELEKKPEEALPTGFAQRALESVRSVTNAVKEKFLGKPEEEGNRMYAQHVALLSFAGLSGVESRSAYSTFAADQKIGLSSLTLEEVLVKGALGLSIMEFTKDFMEEADREILEQKIDAAKNIVLAQVDPFLDKSKLFQVRGNALAAAYRSV